MVDRMTQRCKFVLYFFNMPAERWRLYAGRNRFLTAVLPRTCNSGYAHTAVGARFALLLWHVVHQAGAANASLYVPLRNARKEGLPPYARI